MPATADNTTRMDAYVVKRVIKDALYGKILLARHTTTKELVAIKRLKLSRVQSRTRMVDRQRLQIDEDAETELRVLRRLSKGGKGCGCAGIVSLREDFEEDGFLHMVLDYCGGGELFDTLCEQTAGCFPEKTARKYFSEALEGILHMHAQGIIHRDVSLENLLLANDGSVKLADMGLSADIRADGHAEPVGKGFYAAPEVNLASESARYDGRKADAWSVGIVLFMMLTGVPPFETADTGDSRFLLVRDGKIRQMVRDWGVDGFSEHAMAVLAGLLTVDPEKRMTLEQAWQSDWLKSLGLAASPAAAVAAVAATTAVDAAVKAARAAAVAAGEVAAAAEKAAGEALEAAYEKRRKPRCDSLDEEAPCQPAEVHTPRRMFRESIRDDGYESPTTVVGLLQPFAGLLFAN